MVDWIEPLELKTWFLNVFSGNPDVFSIISLISIGMFAGFFRMTSLVFFTIVILFLGMFSDIISPSIYIFTAIMGGLVGGIVIKKLLD